MSDVTLVDDCANDDSSSSFTVVESKVDEESGNKADSSFFVAGAVGIKVKATVSAFAKGRGGHGNCPACKAKKAAAQEEKERIEKLKGARNGVKNARPAWRW